MMANWIILFLIAWLAATISGSAGFGGALILLPILTNIVGVKAAVPILTIAQLLGNMSRAWFGWREIRIKPVLLFILGAIPTAIIGAILFVSLPKQYINIGIGILLIVVVIMRRIKLFDFKINELFLIPGGALVGFLSAVAGSAGPLGAAFFLGLNLPAIAYVSSEAVTAVTMHITKTVMYNKYALIGLHDLLLGMFLGLAMIIGSWTGKKLIQKFSREKFLLLVEVLMVISGLQLIFFNQ